MSGSAIALAAIDQQIEARDKRIAKLRPVLENLEKERDALVQSRAILAMLPSSNGLSKTKAVTPAKPDIPVITNQPTMLDIVEEILDDGELHVEDITKKLNARGMTTSKAVVTTALARRAAAGKRFRRVEGKPNTFARLKQSTEGERQNKLGLSLQ